MSYSIQRNPPIPQEIIDAIDDKRLVVFIGSGVSQIKGYKSWKDLSCSFVNELYEMEWINFKEKETLLNSNNYKKTITICHYLFKKNKKDELFYEKLKKLLTLPKNTVTPDIYREISNFHGIFVTTNADTEFNKMFVPENIYIVGSNQNLPIDNIPINSLFQIHGNIKDNNSLVFTVSQYIDRYNNSEFQEFLEKIFKSGRYTVLFVGYGLAEFELLDFLIAKFGKNEKGNQPALQHFTLLTFYSGEENILEFEKSYYADMGINVIPYEKDLKGYRQLYDIIKNWNSKILLKSRYLMNSYSEIEKGINNNDFKDIFQLIKNEKPQEEYFFRILPDKDNAFQWFFPLKNEGYFNSERVPGPEKVDDGYHLPIWNVLPYLEKVSFQIVKLDKQKYEEYTDAILNIIKDVTNHAQKEEKEKSKNKNFDLVLLKKNNYQIWRFFISILSYLPNDKITNEFIDMLPFWLDSQFDSLLQTENMVDKLFPKFLNSNNKKDIEKVELILKYLTDIKEIKIDEERKQISGKKTKPIFLANNYYLEECFKRYAHDIGTKCSVNVIFSLSDNLIKLFLIKYGEKNDLKYSFFFIPSLVDIDEHKTSIEEILIWGLRQIILYKTKSDKKSFDEIFDKFLMYKYPIFERFIIYVIANQWDDFNEKFWKLIKHDQDLFKKYYLQPELFFLLKNNAKKISETHLKKIKKIIEKGPKVDNNDEIANTKDKEKYIARWKQRWYLALKENNFLANEYDKYKKITNIDVESRTTKVEVSWISNKSPLTVHDILGKNNDEIAKFLSKYKSQNNFEGPNMEGLAATIQSAVVKDPDKFINNLTPFLETDYLYVYYIISGISEIINKGYLIDWNKLIGFLKEYVSQNKFWDDNLSHIKNSDYHADHLWVVRQIGEMIINLFYTNKEKSISLENFLSIRELLEIIINKLLNDGDYKNEDNIFGDAVSYILNSAYGKILTGFIFSITENITRKNKKNDAVKWEDKDRNLYKKVLNADIKDAYILLGFRMNLFYYFDKSWLKYQIDETLKKKDAIWEVFMEGYLFSSKIAKDRYHLMQDHYKKAIKYKFKNHRAEESLAHHITLSYLEGSESLQKGLFKEILENAKKSHIIAIINFIFQQKDTILLDLSNIEDEKFKSNIKNKKKRIIKFWEWLFNNRFRDKKDSDLDENDKIILSNLSKLVVFLDDINDINQKWLELSALYASVNYNVPSFLEWLAKIKKSENAYIVGKILRNIAQNERDYYISSSMQNNIRTIVEFLYDNEQRDIANEIVNIYGMRDLYFLKDLWKENNEKNDNNDKI